MAEHNHPLTEGEIKKESVPTLPYAGEGCEEHYNERTIITDSAYSGDNGKNMGIANPYLRAMVIGEAIGTPRCKNRYNKRRG